MTGQELRRTIMAAMRRNPANYRIEYTEGRFLSSGVSKCFVFYEVLDGLTTKDGRIVPSTYCLGRSPTPPVLPTPDREEK